MSCRQVGGWRVSGPICWNWRLQRYVIIVHSAMDRGRAHIVEARLNHNVCMDVGKYLSYQEWGKKPSGRVRLQSGDAKRPMRWRVENLENNTFSLEAVRVYGMVLTCL